MTDQKPSNSEKSRWEDWATRSAAVLAVLAALASARWGAANLQAILKQGQINDAWAYYQARSMKQHEAEQARDMLLAMAKGETPERATAFDSLRARLTEAGTREEQAKLQQQRRAMAYQAARDAVLEGSFWLELSFAALQLGVILCTIAIGAKSRLAWIVGIVCGVIGLLLLVNATLHLYHAPRSWYQGAAEQMDNGG